MLSFEGVPGEINSVIKQTMLITAGTGAGGVFVPLVDEAAIAASWGRMLWKIGQYHNVSLSADECAKIGTICIASVMAYKVGSKVLTWAVTIASAGLVIPVAVAGNAALNAFYTRQIGISFHKMLDTEGINGKTVKEIGRILFHYFNPIPSLRDLRDIWRQINGGME